MNWKEIYHSRIVSAQEAVSRIKSGDRVVIGHACAEPLYLVDAMVQNREMYRDVEIVQMVPMGKCEYTKPGMESYFRLNAIFAGAGTRDAIYEGRADFTPCCFSRVPKLFDRYLPVDVALIQVTPPDKYGNCSLGLSVDFTKAAAKKAKLVIAQVNDQMPYVYGDSRIPVNDIDLFVEKSLPIPELAPRKTGEVEKRIGEYCASLVDDGATLQLGIGGIPDAVCACLHDKRDLGLHSELLSDGVVDLIEEGVINNSRKTLNPGKSVATFLMGTRKLYDFVDHNPDFELYPVDVVNNPDVIMKNKNMISINSCIQVDLMGQVDSEAVGDKQISGIGGQVNFVKGAVNSPGGKSIIAMASTASKGTISKIVPKLEQGAVVTTLRTDVDYIVTEYGIARLTGHTLRQRATALINIAHPKFRPMLIEAFEQRFHRPFDPNAVSSAF
ncbi:4-hydroxybutyrate CoA-transferase [Catenibacillus scindens]|uniref:4-hydroxybutyrate CoA-transferase n=1 Tax=Catenibacillus scindens TaxID=673271 RepID=A0A7W8HC79_9FIRM|nr:acetyl-CoA hydrolase/transferase family protein [Catenibacillus scindens]MBB5265055.1 4-hydroxybutyrate CoA-transferase [Catenibacillus scindens]